MSITDGRLQLGQELVREESEKFLNQLAQAIGKKTGGWHILKVKLDDDGYIDECHQEHSTKRRVPRPKS